MVVSTVAMGVSIEKKRHTTTIHPTLGMSNSVEVEEDLHSGKNEVVVAKEVSASILKATVTKITQTSSTNKTEETQIASKEQIRSITEVTYLDSRCTVCDSTYHWMKDCPHNTTFTMYIKSKIQEFYVSKLVGESFAGVLLDCGCTKTVCGSAWYKDYISNLSEEDKRSVTTKPSNAPYKFGDGKVVHSYQQVNMPVYIENERGMMETEVVDQEIPLLISKEAMRKHGVILNFSKDTAIFNGKEIKLETTSSGHYLITLSEN